MKKIFMSMLLVVAGVMTVSAQEITENGHVLAKMADVVTAFPAAKSVSRISSGVYDVLGSAKESVGTAIISTPFAGDISGFSGPTPLLIAVGNDGLIKNVVLLNNDETPNFVQRVRNSGLFSAWNGMKLKDVSAADVDAVSGATFTSTSVIKTMKAAASAVSKSK